MGEIEPPNGGPPAAVIGRSEYSFADTVARLSAAIVASGSTLFLALDQQAAAASVGLELRPTMLLIFGNPKGGTPLMDAFPPFALELPLKIAIWQDGENVEVSYVRASVAARRYNVTGKDAQLAAMDRLLHDLASSIQPKT
jgi:uncharacterized protein (DUF302 family)